MIGDEESTKKLQVITLLYEKDNRPFKADIDEEKLEKEYISWRIHVLLHTKSVFLNGKEKSRTPHLYK